MNAELSHKKILVTGANGFVGRHLCARLLGQGGAVLALVRNGQAAKDLRQAVPVDDIVCCDLGAEALPAALCRGVETIFHLAGVVHAFKPVEEVRDLYTRVNVRATEAILAQARQYGVKNFIYFSSIKAMADPGEECVDENWTARPDDPYGESKRQAEESVLAAGRSGSLKVCNLRPPLVYGPGAKGNLQRMLEAIAGGRFPPPPDTGNRRSLIHVDDLISAALLALENPIAHGKTYIVSDGNHYSTREMYDLMVQALGRKRVQWAVPALLFRLAGELGQLGQVLSGRRLAMSREVVRRLLGSACYRNDLICRELGFVPQWNLAAAMAAMAEPYRREGSR